MRKTLLALFICCMGQLAIAQNLGEALAIKRERTSHAIDDFFDPSLKPFYHGVASGDPLKSQVIIWTRVTPDVDEAVNVSWRISTTPDMNNVVNSGVVTTDLSRDYTVKVDVTGLQPATTYYYDFLAMGASSIVGRTKTAPEGDADQLRFAVVSCSNYQNGFFNAYERISERNDLDAVIHLGDYIYEYETGEFGSDRGHLPENEIISLTDYRVRYSYYRLDQQLRKVHQQAPFITIWDDHEFANNAWMDGAQNHQPEEGDWNVRKNNAYQAYFEWMPVRSPVSGTNPNQIYRKINYGDMLDLLLLDTRIEGREEQEGSVIGKRETARPDQLKTTEEYKQYLNAVLPDMIAENLSEEEYELLVSRLSEWAVKNLSSTQVEAFTTSPEFSEIKELVEKAFEVERRNAGKKVRTAEIERQLLGEEQFTWLENNLQGSDSRWKVVANQVLLTPLRGVPLTDTWDGYVDSRDRLLNFIKDRDVDNVVVITGDIHMTLAGDLPTSFFEYTFNKSNSAAVEFVTPSVTSSNLGEFAGITEGFLTWLLEVFNPQIQNANLSDHGYFVLTLNDSRAQADWFYVDDIKTITSGQTNGESWFVNSGETQLRPASNPISSTSARLAERAPETPQKGNYNLDDALMVIGNYPNPSDAFTIIHYALLETSEVDIQIMDMKGNVVKKVIQEEQLPNIYALPVSTSEMSAGLYFYQVKTKSQTITRKLVVK